MSETQTQAEAAPEANADKAANADKSAENKGEFKLPDEYKAKDGKPDIEKIIGRMSEYEAERNARGEPPESPDKYEFKAPEGLKLPDGTAAEIDVDSDIYKQFRTTAHELGLTQDQAQKIFDLGVEMQFGMMAQAGTQAAARTSEEKAKLGSKADQRIDNVGNWLKAHGGDEAGEFMEGLNSAAQVVFLEKIIAKFAGAGAAGASKSSDAKAKPGDDLTALYPSMAR